GDPITATQQVAAVRGAPPAPAGLNAGAEEFGKLTPQIARMRNDRAAVVRIVERLPKSERKLLPEIIPTVDALINRAVELGRTLQVMEGDVDTPALDRLDQRIAALRSEK